MKDLYIYNIDTGVGVRVFKNVTEIQEGAIPGSLVLTMKNKSFMFKLRDCDCIEIYESENRK